MQRTCAGIFAMCQTNVMYFLHYKLAFTNLVVEHVDLLTICMYIVDSLKHRSNVTSYFFVEYLKRICSNIEDDSRKHNIITYHPTY